MNIKKLVTAGVFSTVALLSTNSLALTTYTYNASSTIGQFGAEMDTGFTAEGFDLTLANAQTTYLGYNWATIGQSILGTNAATNVNITLSLFNTLAGGQVNLNNPLLTPALGVLDNYLDSNLNTVLGLAPSTSINSLFAPYIATLPLLQQGAASSLLNSSSLQVALQAVPEPETYAMMLLGLGLIGFTARRRQTV